MPSYIFDAIPLNKYGSMRDGAHYFPEGIVIVSEGCIAVWLPWEEVLSNHAKSTARTRATL